MTEEPTKVPVPWWLELPVWTAAFALGWVVLVEVGTVPLEFRIVAVGVAVLVMLRTAAVLWDGRERDPQPSAARGLAVVGGAVSVAGVATFAVTVGPGAGAGLAGLLCLNLGVNALQRRRHG